MNLLKVRIAEVKSLAAQLYRNLDLAADDAAPEYVASDGLTARFEPGIRLSALKRRAPALELLRPNPRQCLRPSDITCDAWVSVYGILRAVVMNEPVRPGDIEPFILGLDCPVFDLSIETQPLKISARYSMERLIGEQVLRFLGTLAADPRLSEFNPFGICPTCEGLFLKAKHSQVCCSNACYLKHWNSAKIQEDPRYFANKAAQSRAVKKRQRANAAARSSMKYTRKPRK